MMKDYNNFAVMDGVGSVGLSGGVPPPLPGEYVVSPLSDRAEPNFRIAAIRKLKAGGVLFDEHDIELETETLRSAYLAEEERRLEVERAFLRAKAEAESVLRAKESALRAEREAAAAAEREVAAEAARRHAESVRRATRRKIMWIVFSVLAIVLVVVGIYIFFLYTAQSYVKRGDQFRASKDYVSAIECYQRALSFNSRDASARFGLGYIYADQGDEFYASKEYKEAIACYDRAIAIDPQHVSAYNSKNASAYEKLGDIYFKSKGYKEAIEYYNKMLLFEGRNAEVYYKLGYSYQSLGQDNEAHNAYTKCISIDDPSNASAYYNRGLISSTKWPSHRSAISDYRSAARLGHAPAIAHLDSLDRIR
jgi:tetratricopeptide (TPR) repeat protein